MSPPAVGDPVGNYAGAGVLTAAMVSGPGRRSKPGEPACLDKGAHRRRVDTLERFL